MFSHDSILYVDETLYVGNFKHFAQHKHDNLLKSTSPNWVDSKVPQDKFVRQTITLENLFEIFIPKITTLPPEKKSITVSFHRLE